MRSRGSAGIGPALVAAALLVACGSSDAPASRVHPASDYGGRFVYPLRTEPATLNFVTASDQTADMVSRLVGDSLVDRDAELRLVPRLAESWEFSGGGRVLT